MATLYERIRERREANKMSQTELAKILGYSDRSTIAKIEKGVNDITQSKIELFAQALHTTPAYLMGWSDDPSEEEYGWYSPLRFWNSINDDRAGFLHFYFEAPNALSPSDLKERWGIDCDAPDESSDDTFKAFLKETIESARLYAEDGEWDIKPKPLDREKGNSVLMWQTLSKVDSPKDGPVAQEVDLYYLQQARDEIKDRLVPVIFSQDSLRRGTYIDFTVKETNLLLLDDENKNYHDAKYAVMVDYSDQITGRFARGDVLLFDDSDTLANGEYGLGTITESDGNSREETWFVEKDGVGYRPLGVDQAYIDRREKLSNMLLGEIFVSVLGKFIGILDKRKIFKGSLDF